MCLFSSIFFCHLFRCKMTQCRANDNNERFKSILTRETKKKPLQNAKHVFLNVVSHREICYRPLRSHGTCVFFSYFFSLACVSMPLLKIFVFFGKMIVLNTKFIVLYLYWAEAVKVSDEALCQVCIIKLPSFKSQHPQLSLAPKREKKFG